MANHRWLWIHLHGAHCHPDCPEVWLHDSGKFFVGGHHQLDDPQWVSQVDAMAKWKRGEGPRPEPHTPIQTTCLIAPKEPPREDYPHLSWAYFNKEGFEATLRSFMTMLLDADRTAKLLVYATAGHPDFCELVEYLRDNYRDRYVFVYHKTGESAYIPDDRARPEHESTLWRLADLRFVSREAMQMKRWPDFARDNEPAKCEHELLDLRMGEDGIDRVIADAELRLAATIAEDA